MLIPSIWCLLVSQRGSLPYQVLSVLEHSEPGTVVGNVTGAVDADEGSNAVVYYFIAGDCCLSLTLSVCLVPCLYLKPLCVS